MLTDVHLSLEHGVQNFAFGTQRVGVVQGDENPAAGPFFDFLDPGLEHFLNDGMPIHVLGGHGQANGPFLGRQDGGGGEGQNTAQRQRRHVAEFHETLLVAEVKSS